MSFIRHILQLPKVFVAATLAIAIAAACNQTPIETPVRSFDRPSDVAMTCVIFNPTTYGTDPLLGPLGSYETRDMSACRPLPFEQVDKYCDALNPNCNLNDINSGAFYYPELRALVANSARGEVALVNVPQAILIDLDRENPGFNFIPVGRLPETIRASADGCMAVTANVDSCDLALLDLPTLYNMPFVVNYPGQSRDFSAHVVRRVELWTPAARGQKSRRIESRPTQLELTPLAPHLGNDLSCSGATYHAWIALPGCEAVVEAQLQLQGDTDPVRVEISRAIKFDRNGARIVDPSTLSCPAECTAGAAPSDTSTPSIPSTDRLPQTQAAPGAITIDTEAGTQRLVIGDFYGERLDIIPLDSDTGEPTTPRAIQLEAGAEGVLRERISPRTPAGKFLYAIARDGSVRVVDLDREVECETNPDPTAFSALPPEDPNPDARHLGCLALGDRNTPRRSAQATTPGIRLPNGALARDVAFVHLDVQDPPTTDLPPFSAQPNFLVGDFAWVAGSDGHTALVQVFDACPQPNDPQLLGDGVSYTPACSTSQNLVQISRANAYTSNYGTPFPLEVERLSHRIRNGERRFLQPNNVGDSSGTPRLSDPNTPVTVTVDGSPAKVGAGFRSVNLETVTRKAPDLIGNTTLPDYPTTIEVPDPAVIRGETWTLGWEGVITGTTRFYGEVCGAGNDDCPRGALVDVGSVLCSRGVQAGDKVDLLGCNSDDDCVYTQVCSHDPAAPAEVTSGLCLDRDDNTDPKADQLTTCSLLLRAHRRYRISSARQDATMPSGRVADVMQLSEIYEPEFLAETHACVVDSDCLDIKIPAPDSDIVQRDALYTSCQRDTDGQKRCLRACDPLPACSDGLDNDGDGLIDADDPDCLTADGKFNASGTQEGTAAGVNGNPTNTDDGVCGKGYLCAQTNTSTATQRDYRCMRAPLDVGLLSACFEKTQRYDIRVGGGWSVSGSSTGFLASEVPDPVTRECGSPPVSSEFYRLRSPRIPLDPPLCPQQIDASLGVDALSWVGAGGPNACQFSSGTTADTDKLLHFENPYLAFALRMPLNPTGYIPDDDTLLTFAVVGGGFPLSVQLGISGQLNAQSPRVMVTGPDQQTVFVVDEGKGTASTALRGQLLRLVSSVQTCDPAFQVR